MAAMCSLTQVHAQLSLAFPVVTTKVVDRNEDARLSGLAYDMHYSVSYASADTVGRIKNELRGQLATASLVRERSTCSASRSSRTRL